MNMAFKKEIQVSNLILKNMIMMLKKISLIIINQLIKIKISLYQIMLIEILKKVNHLISKAVKSHYQI